MRCCGAGASALAYGWTKLPIRNMGISHPAQAPRACHHVAEPLRREHGCTPQIYASAPKKGTETKTQAHACSLLRPFYSHMLGKTWSIPLPRREEDLKSPAPPWGTQSPPGSPRHARAFCTHMHTHMHPDPGTRNDTRTCRAEPSLAGLPGQAGLWLTLGGHSRWDRGGRHPRSVQELPGFTRGCQADWVSCRTSQTPVNPHREIP